MQIADTVQFGAVIRIYGSANTFCSLAKCAAVRAVMSARSMLRGGKQNVDKDGIAANGACNSRHAAIRELSARRWIVLNDMQDVKPVGRCSYKYCDSDIYYEPYYYNGRPLCERCCKDINSKGRKLEYAKGFDEWFWEFFDDCYCGMIYGDERREKLKKAAELIMEEFIDEPTPDGIKNYEDWWFNG